MWPWPCCLTLQLKYFVIYGVKGPDDMKTYATRIFKTLWLHETDIWIFCADHILSGQHCQPAHSPPIWPWWSFLGLLEHLYSRAAWDSRSGWKWSPTCMWPRLLVSKSCVKHASQASNTLSPSRRSEILWLGKFTWVCFFFFFLLESFDRWKHWLSFIVNSHRRRVDT